LQVWRWRQQYLAQLRGQPLPEMVHLIQWLEDHIPQSDSDTQVTCVSHGDYRHASLTPKSLSGSSSALNQKPFFSVICSSLIIERDTSEFYDSCRAKLPAGFFPSRPLPIDIPLRNDKCMLHVPLTASLPFQNSELLAQIDAPWGLTIRMPAMSLLIR
jgi:hypothetical protein